MSYLCRCLPLARPIADGSDASRPPSARSKPKKVKKSKKKAPKPNEDSDEEEDDDDEEEEEEEEAPAEEEEKEEEKEESEGEGQDGVALDPKKKKTKRGGVVFDLRYGEIPEGLRLVSFEGDEQKPTFRPESHGSSALAIPQGSYLEVPLKDNVKDLNTDFTVTIDLCVEDVPSPFPILQTAWGRPHESNELELDVSGVLACARDRQGMDEGDSTKRLKKGAGKYSRLVFAYGDQTANVYIDGELVLETQLLPQGDGNRWSVKEGFLLFAGETPTQMPGGATIRRIQVEPCKVSADDVAAERNIERTFSRRAESEAKLMRKMWTNLTFREFEKKPRPCWLDPSLLAHFCEPFAGVGGSLLRSARVLDLALDNMITEQRFTRDFSHSEKQDLEKMAALFKARKPKAAAGSQAPPGQPLWAKLSQKLEKGQAVVLRKNIAQARKQVEVGGVLVVPIAWLDGEEEQNYLMLVLERKAKESWRVGVINPCCGREYHVKTARAHPKLKFKTALVMDDVAAEKIHDEGWWAVLLQAPLACGQNGPDVLYDLLFPWLKGKVLDSILAEEVCEVDFRTPAYSDSSSFHRTYLEAFHYLLRIRYKWPKKKSKLFSLRLREVMLSWVANDVKHCVKISRSDIRLVGLVCRQFSLASVKGTQDEGGALDDFSESLQATRLNEALDEVNGIEKLLADSKKAEDADGALQLDLTTGANRLHTADCGTQQPTGSSDWDQFPLFEYFIRQDISGKQKGPKDAVQLPNLNFFDMPNKIIGLGSVAAHDDTHVSITSAWHTIRTCDYLCARLDNIGNMHFVKCSLVAHTFTRLLPLPLGTDARAEEGASDIWHDTRVTQKFQTDVCITLQRIATHYGVSALSVVGGREFEAQKIITLGALCAIMDAVLRQDPVDIAAAPIADALRGEDPEGKDEPRPFGLSHHSFAKQLEAMDITSPDLSIARSRILEYFEQVRAKQHIWAWEEGRFQMEFPDRAGEGLAKAILRHMYNPARVQSPMTDQYTASYYPEFVAFRDAVFWWKYLMVPDRDCLPAPGSVFTYDQGFLAWKMGENAENKRCYRVIWQRGGAVAMPTQKPCDPTSRGASLALASELAGAHVFTEDDVLHVPRMPTFDNLLSQSDVELLVSYLTAPYIRIPMLLNFFSSENRIHALRNKDLQKCLQGAILEPAAYCSPKADIPTEVPTSQPELLGTPFGLLMNEICWGPKVLMPIMCRFLDEALALDISDPWGSTIDLILFAVRLCTRVEAAANFLLEVCRGEHPSIGPQDLKIDDTNLRMTVQEVDSSLQMLQLRLRKRAYPMLDGWLDQVVARMLEEEQMSQDKEKGSPVFVSGAGESRVNGTYEPSGGTIYGRMMYQKVNDPDARLIYNGQWIFYISGYKYYQSLYSSPFQTMDLPTQGWKCEEGDGPAPEVMPSVNKQARLACNFHAHRMLLLRQARTLTRDVVSDILCSFIFLTIRHTWNISPTNVPDPEVYDIMNDMRRKIVGFLDDPKCSYKDFYHILDNVHAAASNRRPGESGPQLIWCKVQGEEEKGRYAAISVTKSRELVAQLKDTAIRRNYVPAIDLGIVKASAYAEMNVQTLTFQVNGNAFRALDQNIVQDVDVATLVNTSRGAVQCVVKGSWQEREDRYVTGEGLLLHAWTPDQDQKTSLPYMCASREYDPEELFDSESWVADIFEPVRKRYFCGLGMPPKDLQFYMGSEEELHRDSHVAFLVAEHLKIRGRAWKEVAVYRHYRMVQVFQITSHGRRFHRKLQYTTNAQLTMHALQPPANPRQPMDPWPAWGRHEARDDDFDDTLEDPFPPPPHSSSVAIYRRRSDTPEATQKDAPSAPATVRPAGAEDEAGEGVPATEEEELETMEQYIPPRLLQGLVPAALFEQYYFWQETVPPFSLRGVSKDGDPEKKLRLTLSKRSMVPGTADENAEQPTPVSARVCATIGTPPKWYCLLNMLTAPDGSPLHSLARLLCRFEPLSHVLCWAELETHANGEPGPSPARLMPSLVQMPRLGLSFIVQKDENGTRLFSQDHGQLFVPDFPIPPEVTQLMAGMPHAIVLSDDYKALTLLVPNVLMVRPKIKGQPFSTELVADRLTQRGAQWLSKAAAKYFMYPVHLSKSFLQPPTLSSSMYLLLLRFFHRDYSSSMGLINSVSVDAELTTEELQTFQELGIVQDTHPDAHALRCKLTLATLSSGAQAPWEIRQEFTAYVQKLSHVSARCRLSLDDEREMSSEIKTLGLRYSIVENLLKPIDRSTQYQMAQIMENPEALKSASAALKQRTENFIAATKSAFRGERLSVGKDDITKLFLAVMYGSHRISDSSRMLLENRRDVVEALKDGKAKVVECRLMARPTSGLALWVTHENNRAFEPDALDSLRAYRQSDGPANLSATAANDMITEYKENGPDLEDEFFRLYWLFAGAMKLRLLPQADPKDAERWQHTFATLMVYLIPESMQHGPAASVFNIFARNRKLLLSEEGRLNKLRRMKRDEDDDGGNAPKALIKALRKWMEKHQEELAKTCRLEKPDAAAEGDKAGASAETGKFIVLKGAEWTDGVADWIFEGEEGDAGVRRSLPPAPVGSGGAKKDLPGFTPLAEKTPISYDESTKFWNVALPDDVKLTIRVINSEFVLAQLEEPNKDVDDQPPPVTLARKGCRVPACRKEHRMAAMNGRPGWYDPSVAMECDRCHKGKIDDNPLFWHCKACESDLCTQCAALQAEVAAVDPPGQTVKLPFRFENGRLAAVDGFSSRGLFDRRDGGSTGKCAEVSNYSCLERSLTRLGDNDDGLAAVHKLLRESESEHQSVLGRLLGNAAAAALQEAKGGQANLPAAALQFDISKHPEVLGSEIAKRTIERLQQDVAEFRLIKEQAKNFELRGMQAFEKTDDPSQALSELKQLQDTMLKVKAGDTAFETAARAELLKSANAVSQGHRQALEYLLLRKSGHEAELWFELIVGTLLSTKGVEDWMRVNPYVGEGQIKALMMLVTVIMLRVNRIGHTNRALGECDTLIGLFSRIKKSGKSDEKDRILVAQSASSLVGLVRTERAYTTSGNSFDPRCLAFEFAWDMVLRKPQYELVAEFMQKMQNEPVREGGEAMCAVSAPPGTPQQEDGKQVCRVPAGVYERNEKGLLGDGYYRRAPAIVRQLIMGAGKTTVVGPMLTLMLADGSKLVTQVMPQALLELSRSVLRKTFSTIMYKRVCTFTCERTAEVDQNSVRRVESAMKTGAVLVSTPASIKSLILKFIEDLRHIPVLTGMGGQDSAKVEPMIAETVQWAQILRMMQQGIVIMDEVDMVLHPLTSELNFPTGSKQPLDFSESPTCFRWKLPLHMIDAFFYAMGPLDETTVMSAELRQNRKAMELLQELKAKLTKGFQERMLMQIPHLVLLRDGFYFTELLPILREWAMLFISHAQPAVNDDATRLDDGELKDLVQKYITRTCPGVTKNDRKQIEADFAKQFTSPWDIKLLNFATDWLAIYLPHCLRKIDRVTFGLMSESQAQAEKSTTPLSRIKLAIPFVGKDVPSQSSEFAHPDVLIGLTIMAFRYEGLRYSDFADAISKLVSSEKLEFGPHEERPSARLFKSWVEESGGRMCQAEEEEQDASGEVSKPAAAGDPAETLPVLPLHYTELSNTAQMQRLYDMLCRRTKCASLIAWYLLELIFPSYMKFQVEKISASGQELGGEMLFQKRIGFSGTPTDLLPLELGNCVYQRGDDGMVLHTLTSDVICSVSLVQGKPGESKSKDPAQQKEQQAKSLGGASWSVEGLLDLVSESNVNALIDTGALITGKSNKEVAKYLLEKEKNKPKGTAKECCVFLDEEDRKMVLIGATGAVIKEADCGIPKSKRFAFYDQVHTTGMDIKHAPNAKAIITIGKDMTFRDYAQGAYRMRGIGQGQTLSVWVIPEVEELMREILGKANRTMNWRKTPPATEKEKLNDVAAWLIINSMRSERLQYLMLQTQNAENIWRKPAFQFLLRQAVGTTGDNALSTSWAGPFCADSEITQRRVRVFTQYLKLDVESKVPRPLPIADTIQARKKEVEASLLNTSAITARGGELDDLLEALGDGLTVPMTSGVTVGGVQIRGATLDEIDGVQIKSVQQVREKFAAARQESVDQMFKRIAEEKKKQAEAKAKREQEAKAKENGKKEEGEGTDGEAKEKLKPDKSPAIRDVLDRPMNFRFNSDTSTDTELPTALLGVMGGSTLRGIVGVVSKGAALSEDLDEPTGLDGEMQQEREQEQEQEQEQELEVEQFLNQAYRRDNEQPVPWKFEESLRPGVGSSDNLQQFEDSLDGHTAFYPAADLRLWKRKPLAFPEYMYATNNYFNRRWSGHRRLKNVSCFLEWVPQMTWLCDNSKPMDKEIEEAMLTTCRTCNFTNKVEERLTEMREQFERSWKLLKHNDNSDELKGVIIRDLLEEAFDHKLTPTELMQDLRRYGYDTRSTVEVTRAALTGNRSIADVFSSIFTDGGGRGNAKLEEAEVAHYGITKEALWNLLVDARHRKRQRGRFYLAVTLNEAATIRRILHARRGKPAVDGASVGLSLRCVDTDMDLVSSSEFKTGHIYQKNMALSCLRFLDCKMQFTKNQVSLLLRGTQLNTPYERRRWFEYMAMCKRRLVSKWEDTPIAQLFALATEFHLLFQRSLALEVRRALDSRLGGNSLLGVFQKFDLDDNGALSPEEMWCALDELGVASSADQVFSFFDAMDVDHDRRVTYPEFVRFLERSAGGSDRAVTASVGEANAARAQVDARILKEKRAALQDISHKVEAKRVQVSEIEKQRYKEEESAIVEAAEAEEEETLGENPRIVDGGCSCSRGPGQPNLTHVEYDFQRNKLPAGCAVGAEGQCSRGYEYVEDLGPLGRGKKRLKIERKQLHMSIGGLISRNGDGHPELNCLNRWTLTIWLQLQRPQGDFASLVHFDPATGGTELIVKKDGEITLVGLSPLPEFEEKDVVGHQSKSLSRKLRAERSATKFSWGTWNLLSLVVDAEANSAVVWLNGQVVLALQHHPANQVDGDLSLRLDHGFSLFGYSGSEATNLPQAQLRAVLLHEEALGPNDILLVQVPRGVWRCKQGTCTACNPPVTDTSQTITCCACHAPKPKSGVPPPDDKDPGHPGLTIVTAETFDRIVIRSEAHVFLDVTADWCGPSVAMKPDWHQLAKITEKFPDIIIGKMDSDENEQDRELLPETSIPTLKLFRKGAKRTPIPFPSGTERKVQQFMQFLQAQTGFNFGDAMRELYPGYRAKQKLDVLAAKISCALQVAKPQHTKRWVQLYLQDLAGEPDQQLTSNKLYETPRFPCVEGGMRTGPSVKTAKSKAKAKARAAPTSSDVESKDWQWPAEHQEVGAILDRLLIDIQPGEKVIDFAAKKMAAERRTIDDQSSPPTLLSGTKYGLDDVDDGKHTAYQIVRRRAVRMGRRADLRKSWPAIQKAIFSATCLQEGKLDVLVEQLRVGMDVNVEFDGRPLVHHACGYNNLQLLEFMYVNGADLQLRATDGALPLEVAAFCGSDKCARFLMDQGCVIGRAMHLAAVAGETEILKMFLDRQAPVNARCEGFSAIDLAAIYCRNAVVKVLLDRSANVEAALDATACRTYLDGLADAEVSRPELLHLLVVMGGPREEATDLVVRKRAKLDDATRNKLLKAAIPAMCKIINPSYFDTWKVICEFLAARPDDRKADAFQRALEDKIAKDACGVNARNASGWTPLMVASFINNGDITEMLLKKGGDPYMKNFNGQTALLWAKWVDSGDVVKVLEDRGKTMTASDDAGLQRLRSKKEGAEPDTAWLLDLNLKDMRSLGSKKESHSQLTRQISQRMMDCLLEEVEHFNFVMPNSTTRLAEDGPTDADTNGVSALHELFDKLLADGFYQNHAGREFPTWCDLVFNAKLFVQDKIAAGSDIAPTTLFLLFVYHADQAISARVNQVLSGKGSKMAQVWIDLAHAVMAALRGLPAERRVVFRGTQCTRAHLEKLLKYKEGEMITWRGLPSCTLDRLLAANCATKDAAEDMCSVIFKVRTQSARSTVDFSYQPEHREVVLFGGAPPGKTPVAHLKVIGLYKYTDFNAGHGSSLPWSVSDMELNTRDWLLPKKLQSAEADAKTLSKLLIVLEEVPDQHE